MKKVFVLMLAALMVFSIAAIASGFTGVQSASGNTTFVQGAEDIQSGSLTGNAVIDVYQWLNYYIVNHVPSTNPGVINTPTTSNAEQFAFADIYVSSNATVTVTIQGNTGAATPSSLWIAQNLEAISTTPQGATQIAFPEWFYNPMEGNGNNGGAPNYFTIRNTYGPSNLSTMPTTSSGMNDLQLIQSGPTPYYAPAGLYVIPVAVIITTTVGF
jgi:hypothetical protein